MASEGHEGDRAPGPRRTCLLVDYGGVLTSDLFASFRAFCEAEGLEPDEVVRRFAHDRETRALLTGLESGHLTEDAFADALAGRLGVQADGLVDRMFAGSRPDLPMRRAVAAARERGVRTGLVSNSWVERHYEPDVLALFDGIVLSGREGMRKPAPEMYALGARRAGAAPEQCVFVDDLAFNLKPAAELGMATVHHVDSARTIAELETLLGVPLTTGSGA